MKTREQMIKVIYEKIADKTLNKGCKFNHDGIEFTHSGDTNADEVILESIEEGTAYIIGHPVMINRVEYCLEKNDYLEVRNSISKKELLLPIDEWNIEAINLLYKKIGL